MRGGNEGFERTLAKIVLCKSMETNIQRQRVGIWCRIKSPPCPRGGQHEYRMALMKAVQDKSDKEKSRSEKNT